MTRQALVWQLELACCTRLATDDALASKVRYDGADRRPGGTPQGAPRRDARR